jgi:hypothetical protein
MKLGIYKHYKGNLYQVIGLSRHSETLEEYVVYQSLYGDYGLWIRPKSLFESQVTHNLKEVNRFVFVGSCFTHAPSVKH